MLFAMCHQVVHVRIHTCPNSRVQVAGIPAAMAPKKNPNMPPVVGATAKAKPKKEPDASWRKRRRGRRDLLRAVKCRIEKSHEEFKNMGKEPDPKVKKMETYPSDKFLWNAEQFMVSRYCNFLLQSVLILARVFQVAPLLKNTYGEGLMTSARCALFFCRTVEMNNPSALSLTNVQRHIYGRMLRENESRETMEQVLKDEWGNDRLQGINDRIDDWLPGHLTENIMSGRYPLTNLAYDVEKQWDHIWKEPSGDIDLLKSSTHTCD